MGIIRYLKTLRLKWVGHVLRRKENFPAKRAMMMEQQPYEEGSILEDTPEHGSMAELIELAEDREKWRLEVNRLKLVKPFDVLSSLTISSSLPPKRIKKEAVPGEARMVAPKDQGT